MGKRIDILRWSSLMHEMQGLHLRFMELYPRLQDGIARGSFNSLANDPALFGVFGGMTHALIALFSMLGRSSTDDQLDQYEALQQYLGRPPNDEMTLLTQDLADILCRIAMIFDEVYGGRKHDRREAPTVVPPPRSSKPRQDDLRRVSKRPKPRSLSESNLPAYKYPGPYEQMQRLVEDLPNRYSIVCGTRSSRKPRAKASCH